MLASEERMNCVRVMVPLNRSFHAVAMIDETEMEMNVARRNMRKQS